MASRNLNRILIVIAIGLVAIANWPAIILINRVRPFVLGLPLFVFSMLALNVLVALVLLVAYLNSSDIND